MTESEPAAQEPAAMSADSRTDPVESFVSVVTDALAESGADQSTIESVETHGSRMVEHVATLRDENEQLSERVDQLESETERLSGLVDSTRREQAEIRSDVHEVRETVESQDGSGESDSNPAERDETPTPSVSETTTQAPQTPLGDCVTLPQPIQEEQTANVRRAIEVAAGAIDYCRSVPAGYAITSSELRTVLTALKDDDGRTYTATVGRVIEHLDELGSDCVEVKTTMSGQRTVVFDDAFIRRSVAWRQSDRNDVVADGRLGG